MTSRPRLLSCAAFLAGMALAPAWAETVHVRYSVTLLGLPMGTAGYTATLTPTSYRVDGNAKLTGLANLVANSKGAAASSGAIAGARVLPAAYANTATNPETTRTVRMGLSAGNVTAIDITPPFEDKPGRVPLTEASKRGIVDPLSAIVMAVPAGQPLIGPASCDRTIPIFDGYTRFNISLSYVGTREVKTKGYAGPVVVCAVRYTPIAGHRPQRAATKFMTDNKRLEAWLAPVESARILLPFRVSVATQVGTTVIEAQEFVIEGAPGKAAAQ